MNQQKLYNLDQESVLQQLHSSKKGLSKAEVTRRISEHGLNVLSVKKRSLFKRIIEPFADLFVAVLMVAVVISLATHEIFDALVIVFVLVLNAFIYYAQQYSSDKVIKTLRAQDVVRVNVRRGGEIIEVDSENIVPGDIVFLAEGVKIPADGRLIDAENIYINESVLTGESLPVKKSSEVLEGTHQIYDQNNMLFKGTTAHSGSGVMVVGATGMNTELGKITLLATTTDLGRSPIQRKIDDLTKKIIIAVSLLGAVVFVLAIIRGIALAEALRFTISLVVSVVPESLPVALTVVLLFSAKKMASVRALVKKISSIETMGAVTLIATDKTGTLTKNKLTVAQDSFAVKDKAWVIAATLNGEPGLRADPLDGILAQTYGEKIPKGWKKVQDYSFNQDLRMSGALWQYKGQYHLFVKGAPESILQYSKKSSALNTAESALDTYVRSGYRTIGMAQKHVTKAPEQLNDVVVKDLEYSGIVGLADELRPGIAGAIAEAKAAGIKVVMLTGDHIETAREVATKVGIASSAAEIQDSAVLVTKRPKKLLGILQSTTAFGRVLPEHKFNFLRAVKGREITAMTGDGVNDIPALAEADAGLAMGSGSDAAKDASDIVLLDDNFKTIIGAVKQGRAVIANIKKMLFYVISTSVGQAFTMIGALLLGLPLPMTAAQVLWINIVTDGFTVLPLGLSAPEKAQMKRPPYSPDAPLLNNVYLSRIVVTGLGMTIVTLVLFNNALPKGEAYAQTVAFLSLVVAQLANSLNANFEQRSWVRNFIKPNKLLFGFIGLAILFQVMAMYGPLARIFDTARLVGTDIALAIVVPLVAVLIMGDIHKFITKKFNAQL
jgi:Ca2+-transporting ATPase